VIERTRAAFLAWGKETLQALNDGTLPPDRASPYVVRNLAQHLLEDGQTPEIDLVGLVEDGWRLAWEAYEGGYRGFEGDVKLAWVQLQKVVQNNPERLKESRIGLGGQIRCALCLS
jgi:hypothetical protein